MSVLPPDTGARDGKAAGQAQGPVQSNSEPQQGREQAEAVAIPQTNEQPSDDNTPSGERRDDNEGLEPQNGGRGRVFSRTENFAFWTLLATAALAVATLVLAVATADMARSTRTLASLAEQQAHDTQTALATAGRQAAAAEAANNLARDPEVSISQINFPTPVAGSPLTASFVVFDLGRTPASRVNGQALIQILPVPRAASTLEKCSICGESILFPSNGFQGTGLSYDNTITADKMTAEVINAINNGTSTAYLTGRVDYVDAERKERSITLCYVYNPQKHSSGPCQSGNLAQ